MLSTDRTVAFLREGLPPPPATVLEVGCGAGEVAERLVDLGYDVTPIDIDREAVAAARKRGLPAVRADIRSFRGGPYDACVCLYTLHHLSPLGAIGSKFRARLRPEGRLVIGEYAWEEADDATAAFWLDTLRTLESAGVARPHRPLPNPRVAPRAHWKSRHWGEEKLHPGSAMLRMLRIRFEILRLDRVPYLYAILGGSVPGPRRAAVTRAILAIEERRIKEGSIHPLGIQLVARRPSWDSG